MIPSELERITIADSAIEVWLARLDLDADAVSQYASLLSGDERERARRFHFEHDRRRFTVARGTLRTLLGEHLGTDPKIVKFAQTKKGKPLITGASIHFNVSHSHERALIAISDAEPVGVDIEYLQRVVDYAALAERYFTSNEYAVIQSLPEAQRKHAFLTCWTCKEAVAKASGKGLFLSLNSFEAISPPGFTISNHVNGYSLYKKEIESDYVAAVAVSVS